MTDLRAAALRRIEFGLALLAEGAAAEAAEAFAAALALAPDHAKATMSLAAAQEAAGRREDAVAAYRRTLALDPADRLGATARLALLGAIETPSRLPPAYVTQLFEDYAPRFDRALSERLGYQGPALLRQAVARHRAAGLPAARLLDLGCGTGLAGLAFADIASAMTGIDLSAAMIARARARGLYGQLVVGDFATASALSADSSEAPRYDLIVAADSLNYLGDMAAIFVRVRALLARSGLFAASFEKGESSQPSQSGYELGPGQRFRHDPHYLPAAAAAAGLAVLELSQAVLRREKREPVAGLILIARRSDPAPSA
ncbi:MAG: methyltransferase [Kiloniellales bacterium]